jgi:hypothetical protein
MMKKMIPLSVVGAPFLAVSALWVAGSHIAWSAQKILVAAITLALIGLAIYF